MVGNRRQSRWRLRKASEGVVVMKEDMLRAAVPENWSETSEERSQSGGRGKANE